LEVVGSAVEFGCEGYFIFGGIRKEVVCFSTGCRQTVSGQRGWGGTEVGFGVVGLRKTGRSRSNWKRGKGIFAKGIAT
jgi:hypothetical protein